MGSGPWHASDCGVAHWPTFITLLPFRAPSSFPSFMWKRNQESVENRHSNLSSYVAFRYIQPKMTTKGAPADSKDTKIIHGTNHANCAHVASTSSTAIVTGSARGMYVFLRSILLIHSWIGRAEAKLSHYASLVMALMSPSLTCHPCWRRPKTLHQKSKP